MTDRIDRVAEAIKREISVILQKDTNDPRIRQVTITRVEVTRDLRLARVFYVTSVDDGRKKDVVKGLKRAGSFIRGELAGRISMKFTPQVSFREDCEHEKKEVMDDTFERIRKEYDEHERYE